MDPFRDLPLGFGMALVQNEKALLRFGAMNEAEQQKVLDHTHEISSKAEMTAFVDSIAQPQ